MRLRRDDVVFGIGMERGWVHALVVDFIRRSRNAWRDPSFGPRRRELDRIRLADIIYIATSEGWVCLAAVLDLAMRKIVGLSMCDPMRTELPHAAGAYVDDLWRSAPCPR